MYDEVAILKELELARFEPEHEQYGRDLLLQQLRVLFVSAVGLPPEGEGTA